MRPGNGSPGARLRSYIGTYRLPCETRKASRIRKAGAMMKMKTSPVSISAVLRSMDGPWSVERVEVAGEQTQLGQKSGFALVNGRG